MTLTPKEQLAVLDQIWGKQRGWVFLPHLTRSPSSQSWDEGRAFKWPAERGAVLDKLKQHEDDDLYFTPAVYLAPKRDADNLAEERCLWADLDEADPHTMGEIGLKPTIAWETSPGRYQAVWIMRRSKVGASWEGNENQRLTYKLGADKGCWNSTRVLRVPGRRNHKPDRAGAPGRLLWATGPRYTWAMIDNALPQTPLEALSSSPQPHSRGNPRGVSIEALRKRLARDTRQKLNARVAAGDRSEVLYGLTKDILSKGGTVDQAFELLRPTPWADKFPSDDALRRDIERTASKADLAEADLTDVFSASPTLAKIQQAAHSRLVSAPALLCYVLARVIAELPPEHNLPATVGTEASLNLGIAVVGESGDGKSGCSGVSAELLGVDQRSITRSLGSGEGLAQSFLTWNKESKENELIDDPRRVMMVDEIDHLKATKGRAGASIAPTLRTALTGGALGQENATQELRRFVPERSYRLVLLLGVQPTRSGTLLDETDVGTPQRLVWTMATDPNVPEGDTEWPGSLDWELPRDLSALIEYPKHVKEQIREVRRRKVRGDDAGDPRDGHRLLTQLKVAAALTLLHGESVISDRWWDQAVAIMAYSADVQNHCQQVLEEAAKLERVNAGRAEGERAAWAERAKSDTAESFAEEIEQKRAQKVALIVAKHAEPDEGANRKHPPEAGCTARCITFAFRHDKAATTDDKEQAVLDAEALGWVSVQGQRYLPGPSRPA